MEKAKKVRRETDQLVTNQHTFLHNRLFSSASHTALFSGFLHQTGILTVGFDLDSSQAVSSSRVANAVFVSLWQWW